MINGIDGNLASTWAANLFSKLDTQNQGYIDKSDLQSAFSSISGSSGSMADVEDVFEQLDINSDGKVTEDEMTAVLSKLFRQSASGPGGVGVPEGPPPPPPKDGVDEGFTKEELSSQLEEIGSSDSKRASLISGIIENFEAADADGDGKVTLKEAMAYDKTRQADTSSDGSAAAQGGQAVESTVVQQLMKLLSAYQVFQGDSSSSDGDGQLSVRA